MGKRKGTPQRASAEKQQCMSWNMCGDGVGPSGSLSIIRDQDGAILHEIHKAAKDSDRTSSKDVIEYPEISDTSSFSNQDLQQLFDGLLEDCLFFIPLTNTVAKKADEELYEFGSFSIQWCQGPHQSVPPSKLPDNSICWLYISHIQDRNMLYFETEDNNKNLMSETGIQKSSIFWCVKVDLPIKVLESLKNKVFQVFIQDFHASNHCFTVSVYGTSALLSSPSSRFVLSSGRLTNAQLAVQNVLCHFFNLQLETYEGRTYSKKHDVQKIYDHVKNFHELTLFDHDIDLQHPDLCPTLRPYQKQAINWMLYKERFNNYQASSDNLELHILYQEIKTRDGKTLYFNKYSGRIEAEQPCMVRPPPGGILADEMGLGKTVEMLACIMAHHRQGVEQPEPLPVLDQMEFEEDVDRFECTCGSANKKTIRIRRRKKQLHKVCCVKCGVWQHAECVNYVLSDPCRGKFMCPHCHMTETPVISGATLIISPASICHQWVEEIVKHTRKDSLNVFVYKGVSKDGFIQPLTLAKQDIVITTYETLRKEINFVDLRHSTDKKNGTNFRFDKRFMAIPSPIVAVDWWRICLDEAQMVESTTAKAAEMALKLTTVNRWCATGTPIQKGIEDLYGLLLFLGIDPYWQKCWFDKLLYKPLCYGIEKPLFDVISQVLWRTVKNDVIDQINIPKQTEQVHWLTFSPIEDHFYKRQYDSSINDSLKRLSKWTDHTVKLSSLDRQTLNQLLYPLLRLRQACCHPQAVRGEFIPLHLRKTAMTMEELLESLTKKATIECEEAHRLLVAAFNGLAGWHIIKNEYLEAIEMYREVLRSIEEHKARLRTDDLQLLHALYNLNEILTLKPKGVQPTLRDGQLVEQIADLKKKYILKSKSVVVHVQEQLTPIRADILKYQRELRRGQGWWVEIIEHCMDRDIDEELVQHVKEEVDKDKGSKTLSISRSFHNVRGLEFIINDKLVAMETAYETVKESMAKLSEDPSQDLINEATDCCLRPVGKIKAKCPFCKTSALFEDYESKLFSFTEQGLTTDVDGEYSVSTRRQGTWADSDTEKALKAILGFAKQKYVEKSLVEFGQIHMKLMESLKKEFKPFRNLWIELKAHVASYDEISMATTRLRLRLPDEPKPDNTQMNVIEPCELGHHKLKLDSDRTIARNELRKKLGQQLYLKKLAEAQQGSENTENPDPCPICQKELGKEWSVLQCGHCYCLECIRTLCELYSFGGRNRIVTCALCREKTYHSDISYVSTIRKTEVNEQSVKGSHSSKIQGVVKCLKQIEQDNPGAKALVFSTWTDVLSVISQALQENGISHKTLQSGTRFQKNLSAFKDNEKITALLLPIHSGANGLNIIEATNVLLVEPVLNPAQELQAIGRIHRIGQTKPTQVHRFVVKGTIEEKMYTMLKNYEISASSHDTEENVLTIGDLTRLLKEDKEEEEEEVPEEEIVEDNHQMRNSLQLADNNPDMLNGEDNELSNSQLQVDNSNMLSGEDHELRNSQQQVNNSDMLNGEEIELSNSQQLADNNPDLLSGENNEMRNSQQHVDNNSGMLNGEENELRNSQQLAENNPGLLSGEDNEMRSSQQLADNNNVDMLSEGHELRISQQQDDDNVDILSGDDNELKNSQQLADNNVDMLRVDNEPRISQQQIPTNTEVRNSEYVEDNTEVRNSQQQVASIEVTPQLNVEDNEMRICQQEVDENMEKISCHVNGKDNIGMGNSQREVDNVQVRRFQFTADDTEAGSSCMGSEEIFEMRNCQSYTGNNMQTNADDNIP